MDYKKIAVDFNKRYGRECENMYFVGKPITFLSSGGLTLGACVSVGGYIAVSRRNDDRILVQFSDSDKLLCCNKTELQSSGHDRVFDLLARAEECGVSVGGAEILMHFQSKIMKRREPLILCALPAFCQHGENTFDIIKRFDDFENNVLCTSSKFGLATVFDGQKISYAPLCDDRVKLVLCCVTNEKKSTQNEVENTGKFKKKREFIRKKCSQNTFFEAIDALNLQNFEAFGKILTDYSENILKNTKGHTKIKQLFKSAQNLSDSYGVGILENDGIFSVVENSRVDTFIHNLGAEYEKFYGSRPEFYVTRCENSGIKLNIN